MSEIQEVNESMREQQLKYVSITMVDNISSLKQVKSGKAKGSKKQNLKKLYLFMGLLGPRKKERL